MDMQQLNNEPLNLPQPKGLSKICLDPREPHRRARGNIGPKPTIEEHVPFTSIKWDKEAKTDFTTDPRGDLNTHITPQMPHNGWQINQFLWISAGPKPPTIGEEEETNSPGEEEELTLLKPTKGTMLVSNVEKSDTSPATVHRNAGNKSTL
jgi:hypothetical protein